MQTAGETTAAWRQFLAGLLNSRQSRFQQKIDPGIDVGSIRAAQLDIALNPSQEDGFGQLLGYAGQRRRYRPLTVSLYIDGEATVLEDFFNRPAGLDARGLQKPALAPLMVMVRRDRHGAHRPLGPGPADSALHDSPPRLLAHAPAAA